MAGVEAETEVGAGHEAGADAGSGEMSEVALVGSAAAAETSGVGVTVEAAQVEASETAEVAEAWVLQPPGATAAGFVCYQVCAECLDVPGPFLGTDLSRGHAAEPVALVSELVTGFQHEMGG